MGRNDEVTTRSMQTFIVKADVKPEQPLSGQRDFELRTGDDTSEQSLTTFPNASVDLKNFNDRKYS